MTYDQYAAEIQRLQDALARVAKEAVPQWISVKDKLPNEGENVLTYGARPSYDVIYINHLIDKKNGEWLYDGVTHWMPLPQKPESEVDAE